MKLPGVLANGVRRVTPRWFRFRSNSSELVVMSLALIATVALVMRHYGGGRQVESDEVENPLRRFSTSGSKVIEDVDQANSEIDDVFPTEKVEVVTQSAFKFKKEVEVVIQEAFKLKKDPLPSEIDDRLSRIGDQRSKRCANKQVITTSSVSVIIDFTDYEFYDVRNTVDSCLRLNVDIEKQLHEIIVIDDGSTLDYVIEESQRYFQSLPKTTLLRHDPTAKETGNNGGERLGTANARIAGATKATGSILVFLSPTVICSPGWLDPLIDAVAKRPTSIVTPHLDRIRDPVSLEYQPTSAWVVGQVSWDLSIRMREVPPITSSRLTADETVASMTSPEAPSILKSAAVRGDVFAVDRAFFIDVGAYDPLLASEAVNNGAGEHVELSLRTWLCGGSITMATCSRVGVLNLHDPVKVTDKSSVQYIASLWFGSHQSTVMQTYKRYQINSFATSDDLNENALHMRSTKQRAIPRCVGALRHDMDWFLTNVASDMVKPSVNATAFGLLRVKTGRCGRVLPDSARILLETCRPQLYGKPSESMTFELTRDGYLKVTDKCLSVQSNAYVVAKTCASNDTHQLWKYTPSSGHLVNSWSHYCATHVTDPDLRTPGERQIAMAQECSADTSDGGKFTTWEFIGL